MLRYSLLLVAAVLAISTAASAQITLTIGVGNNNQGHYHQQNGYYAAPVRVNHGPPPGHYWCGGHNRYCNHVRNHVAAKQIKRHHKQQKRQIRQAVRAHNRHHGHY